MGQKSSQVAQTNQLNNCQLCVATIQRMAQRAILLPSTMYSANSVEYSENDILCTITRAVIELRSYKDYFSTLCVMSANAEARSERKLNG